MKRQSRILAGTALGLLMASAPFGAAFALTQPTAPRAVEQRAAGLVILAQAAGAQDEELTEEEKRKAEEEAQQAEQPAQEAPAQAEEQPAEEPAEQQAQPETAPAEQPAQAEEQPAEQPAEQQAQPEAAPAEQPAQAEEQPAEQPAEQQAQPEEAPAEQPAQAESDRPAEAEQPAQADGAEQPTRAERREQRREERREQRREQRQAQPEQGEDAAEPAQAEDQQPAAEEPAQQQAEPQAEPGQQPAEQQAQPEQPEGEQPAQQQQAAPEGEVPEGQAAEGEQPATGEEAPILDSAKEAPPAQGAPLEGGQQQPAQAGQEPLEGNAGQPQTAQPAEPTPAPTSDAEAQATIEVREIESVTAEEGERIELGTTREERRERRRERRERRERAEVVREFEDNRTIVEINNRVFIESPDYERIILDRDEVYYEELPRGRQREVIVRPDGTRVVTIRNRYGDIVRRSRILPDNREIVLVYVEDRYYDEVLEWRDPATVLPPLVLDIPREEYILEAATVEDPDVYYTFLEQPPVDTVTRTYSIEEVKRSARVRDIVRRIDLDTINFEFGSAEVTEGEIADIEAVAQAMERILEENPGETFLIEGHTDAVGSDIANLALSDRRAENVARALTEVFAIPPENLTTQGYGEQYLKVNTEEPERENRRVAIRRITPLVAPVASAQ